MPDQQANCRPQVDQFNSKITSLDKEMETLHVESETLRAELFLLSHQREKLRQKKRRETRKRLGLISPERALELVQKRRDYARKYYQTVLKKKRAAERQQHSVKRLTQ